MLLPAGAATGESMLVTMRVPLAVWSAGSTNPGPLVVGDLGQAARLARRSVPAGQLTQLLAGQALQSLAHEPASGEGDST